MSPLTGITTATTVSFSVTATDPNGDPIYYSWDLGDGYTSVGSSVSHRYTSVGPGGSWTVHAYATDNRQGSAVQTSTQGVPIVFQYPPQLSIASAKTVLKNTLTTFTASASDQNGDPLRFTWYWFDGAGGTAGTPTVTTTPSATHSYSTAKIYDIVVHADDLSGLTQNNVSATCAVKVVASPTPPYGATLSALPLSVWTGQNVTFTGSAQDPGGDAMQFNFTFGDGTYKVVSNAATANDAVVTASTTHAYATAGTKTAYMSATDGLNTATTTNVLITVTLNTPPVLIPQAAKNVNNGTAIAFSATASDSEETTLRYTWKFGDGTWAVSRTPSHTYAHAGKYTFTVYADDLTGVPGHNVSSSAVASVAFGVNLVAGWNLVSLPLVGGLSAVYKASTLPGLVVGDLIVEWKPSTQAYNHTYIKGISGAAQNFALNASTGYWVWVAASKTMWIYGDLPTTTQTRHITVPAAGGWVTVGFESLNTTRKAVTLASWFTPDEAGKKISVIASFDPVAKTYKSWLSAVPTLNNFLLVPGQAYWCYLTGSGTLSYAP
jgi:hypothetical protein